MKVGYARVSTTNQNLDLQIAALKEAGCKKIYKEKESSKKERKVLKEMIEFLRKGDIVIVWKLDRLGRTTLELIKQINDFKDKKIGFISIQDKLIDTTTANGKLMFGFFAVLAEHERDIIRERTIAGLKSARARGKVGGRIAGSYDEKKAVLAAKYYNQEMPISQILEKTKIKSRATLYKYLRVEKVFPPNNENSG